MMGGLVDGPRPIRPPRPFSLTASERAPGIVRWMKAGGADNIKAYVGLTESLVAALVRAGGMRHAGRIRPRTLLTHAAQRNVNFRTTRSALLTK